ncbi:MAG: AI-2E family transporter [Dethiobacteria bacterium]
MIKDKEWRLALKFTLAFTAVAILIVMLIKLAPIITIFVIALFIVYLLLPPVSFLIRHRFPPLLAAASAVLVVLLFMFLFFYLLIPGLIIELSELTNFISTEVVGDWSQFIERIADLDGRFNLQLADRLNEYYVTFTSEAPALVQQLLKYLANFSMALVSKAWIGLMLIFLVFYLVQDLEKTKDNLTLLAPQIYQKDVVHILGVVDQKVGAFIRGTLIKSLFVGVLTGVGLAIAGLPFAIMLGALAGIFNIVLYIGPVLAAVPGLLLSLLHGSPNFFIVLAAYVIPQILDGFVFTPVFLGKAADLSPLTVITVILIGGQLAGIAGIILAVPLGAILKVLLVDYYLARNIAPPEEPPGEKGG